MPKEMEEALWKEANKHKNWSDERKRAYVYGTMRKHGWKPEREKKHVFKTVATLGRKKTI